MDTELVSGGSETHRPLLTHLRSRPLNAAARAANRSDGRSLSITYSDHSRQSDYRQVAPNYNDSNNVDCDDSDVDDHYRSAGCRTTGLGHQPANELNGSAVPLAVLDSPSLLTDSPRQRDDSCASASSYTAAHNVAELTV